MKTNKAFRAAISALVLVGCTEPAPPSEPAGPRPVKLYTIQASEGLRSVSLPAVIKAGRSAELTFQVAGTVVEIAPAEGDRVERGEVIARLDQRDAQNRLDQATAEAENATSEFERAARLYEEDAIAKSVLDARKAQRDVSQASLDSARKALADTTLKAPYSGAISRVFVQEFQNVQAKEPVAIIQSGELEAVVNVPGNIVAQIPNIGPRGVKLRLDAAPDVLLDASFKQASGEADPTTATFEVGFEFSPPENILILPGMTATLISTISSSEGKQDDALLSIPLSAIIEREERPHVWRFDDETQTVVAVSVETGRGLAGGHIEIISGVSVGEKVVTAGASFLSSGQSVTPWGADEGSAE